MTNMQGAGRVGRYKLQQGRLLRLGGPATKSLRVSQDLCHHGRPRLLGQPTIDKTGSSHLGTRQQVLLVRLADGRGQFLSQD